MLNISRTMPTTGQFVEVWEYDGQVWSRIYKWKNGILYAFCHRDGCWIINNDLQNDSAITNVQYISEK